MKKLVPLFAALFLLTACGKDKAPEEPVKTIELNFNMQTGKMEAVEAGSSEDSGNEGGGSLVVEEEIVEEELPAPPTIEFTAPTSGPNRNASPQ